MHPEHKPIGPPQLHHCPQIATDHAPDLQPSQPPHSRCSTLCTLCPFPPLSISCIVSESPLTTLQRASTAAAVHSVQFPHSLHFIYNCPHTATLAMHQTSSLFPQPPSFQLSSSPATHRLLSLPCFSPQP